MWFVKVTQGSGLFVLPRCSALPLVSDWQVAESAENLERLGQCGRFYTKKFTEELALAESSQAAPAAPAPAAPAVSGTPAGRGGAAVAAAGAAPGAAAGAVTGRGRVGAAAATASQAARKNVKTLLYFEDCPLPLGCTVSSVTVYLSAL